MLGVESKPGGIRASGRSHEASVDSMVIPTVKHFGSQHQYISSLLHRGVSPHQRGKRTLNASFVFWRRQPVT